MDDWKVWLVVFLGFATALAIGVAVIAVHILSAYAARRRDRSNGYRRHGRDSAKLYS